MSRGQQLFKTREDGILFISLFSESLSRTKKVPFHLSGSLTR